MAKRFTDTNKYKKPFIRGLQGAYKLFWDYLYHDCDHAGIWIVDFEIAQLYLGSDMPVNKREALQYFNKDEIRIIEFDNGKKWFIKSFIEFQYGILNPDNRVHFSILKELTKHKISKPLISSLQGAKDKDKEKDVDKDKDFIDKIVDCFIEEHGSYEIVTPGKEREMAGKILAIYKKKFPAATSEETLNALRTYFNQCVNINDDWLRANMSLSTIVTKFNVITKILNNGTNKKTGGATNEQLASLLAAKLGSDAK